MKALNGPNPWWHRRFSSGVNKLKKLSFDLLSGAWFHKKNIGDTEVIDETPDVDTSRTWHKARALQFNNAESVVVSNLQLCNSALSTWKAEFEFVHTYDGNGGYLFDTRYSNDGAQSPGNGAYIQFINNTFSVSGSGVGGIITSQPLTVDVRYYGYLEFDGSVLRLFYKGDDGSTETLTANLTQQASGQNFYIGRRHDNSSLFRNLLGWMRITQDNIVTAEYAFEEGEGTICYNRVMNNFHGTINNATISTFRVEDVRITNGDQGTFLNTDGYTNTFQFLADGTYGTIPIDTSSATNMSIRWKSLTDLSVHQLYFSSNQGDHWLGYYPSSATDFVNENHLTLNGDVIVNGTIVANTGTAVRSQMVDNNINTFEVTGLDISTWPYLYINRYSSSTFNTRTNIVSIEIDLDGDGVYEYEWDADLKAIKSHLDISITGSDYSNLLIPRPRVTDIPLYNAGKYAYYIPDHTSNYIDLNTAFAGLTNDGDWMEFGIATVGTGEPTGQLSWAVSIDGSDSSSFYLGITNADTRFYSSSGRVQVTDANTVNEDFYSFRITKDQNVTSTVVGIGTIEIFDRDGNLITSYPLTSGPSGNEGTYIYDRFFPSAYGTDFILAYLKLSDGTVWNGANDFNGGVNIANSGTGNVTKIFFESVDEDVLGNPLTYKGQVAQPLSLVNSNGGSYLSAGEYLNISSNVDVNSFTQVFLAKLDPSLKTFDDFRSIYGLSSASIYYLQSDQVYFRANGQTTSATIWSGGSFADEDFTGWQTMFITRNFDTGEITAHINGKTKNVFETASLGEVYSVGSFGQSNNQFFAGEIAYSALYNRVLTAQEIANWDPYNAPQQGLELFHAYTVGGGSTVYDVSGNNNHGTITNATLSNFWIKQDQFHWNLKKGFNKLRRFNGTSNYIQGDGSQGFSNINTQFRFTASFYYDASSSGEHVLFQNVDNTSGDNGDIFYAAFEGHLFFLGFRDVSASVWTNEVFTDPLNAGLYYVNGLYDGNGSWTATINGVAFTNTGSWSMAGAGGGFAIGKRTLASDRYFTGGIKFIEIYDSSDILAHRWSNEGNFVDEVGGLSNQSASLGELYKAPYAPTGDTLSNPAGKWHNDAETEINFPHTAKLHMINEQFNYKPFFYKNAQLDDATAAYSMRKVIADYEGPLLNVIRSSDLQAQDFYPDSRGDLDTAAITSFVNDASPVLDDYTGAAAYSLRKLRTAYGGSAIKVRRSSDDTEQDIGFDANGDLDTSALTTFVNADVTKADTDFSSGFTGTAETGLDRLANQSIGGRSGVLKGTIQATTEEHRLFISAVDTAANTHRIQTSIYIPSGQSGQTVDGFRIENGGFQVYATTTTKDAWVDIDVTWTSVPNANIFIKFLPSGGAENWTGNGTDEVYIGDVTITQTTADGAVTTWYDQAGSSNATQSDPVKMPLVVSGGDVVTEGGKPAMSLVDGQYFENAGVFGYSRFDFFSVSKITDTLGIFLTFSTGGGKYSWVYGQGSTSTAIHSSFGTPTMYSNGVLQSISNRSDVYNAYNGHKIITTLGGDTSSWTDGKFFAYSSGFGVSGTVQEIICYDSDQSSNRTGIEANIGRYYTIDGFADGRVATWYDQANANHATQATPDNQPLVVSGGSVLVDNNGKAKIQATAATQYLTATRINPNPFYAFYALEKGTSTSPFNGFTGQWIDSYGIFFGSTRASVLDTSGTRHDVARGTTMTSGNRYLISAVFDNDIEIYQDGTLEGSVSGVGDLRFSDTSEVLRFFSYSANNSDPDSCLQEVIIFNSDKSGNREDIEKNIADYYDITLSGNAGVESWVKNVSFADMYQIWYDYEYLHRLFANFEIPNKVFKVLAYTSELTADQRQQVYDYLQKNYHPIYTPYSTRVLADGGTLAAGQTNTLTIIDSI